MRKNIVILVAIITVCMVACSNVNTVKTVESTTVISSVSTENVSVETTKVISTTVKNTTERETKAQTTQAETTTQKPITTRATTTVATTKSKPTTTKATTTKRITATKKVTTTEAYFCDEGGTHHSCSVGPIGWVNSYEEAQDKALEYIADYDTSGNFRVEECFYCGKFTASVKLH